MYFPSLAQTCVVVGGNGVNHVQVHIIVGCKLQTAGNYLLHVSNLVCGVKSVVAGQNLRFYVFL